MNIPNEIFSLDRVLFHQAREAAQREETLSALKWFGADLASALMICLAVAVPIIVAVLFAYRPRLVQGSLWLPAFGLFGGTPKLYLHTKPAGFCGLLPKSRRHK